ncbi:MAG: hypothetical protein N3A69_12095, partial [Leptospiraceae bacterium]|nr:hypothetical protein [Leptospiraceae bacterium]
ICFSLLTLSSLVYYNREELYIRPEVYFYLLSLVTGIVFVQILLINEETRKFLRSIIFIEIILISTSFTVTQQALFKTVLGRDPWFHWIFVEEIVRRGFIPPYEDIPMPYIYMPNFHLLIAFGMILSGISYKWSQFLFIGFPTLLLLTLTAFLFYNKLFGWNIAFLSTLFVAIASNVLVMTGMSIIPNSMGIALAFLIFYLVCSKEFVQKVSFKIVAIFLSVALVFTHTISLSLLIFQIFLILIFAFIFRDKYIKNYQIYFLILILLAIFEWAIYSKLFFESLINIFKSLFIYGFDIERYETLRPVSLIESILCFSGLIIYFILAGIGLLWFFLKALKNKIRDKVCWANFTGTGSISAFSIFSYASLAISEITHRFWYYGEVLSSTYIGFLLSFSEKNYKIVFKIFFYLGKFTVVVFLTFLIIKGSPANTDNPLVPNYTLRFGWQDSELEAGRFIALSSSNIPLASDYDFSRNLKYLKTEIVSHGKMEELILVNPKTFEDLKNFECIFIFRKELIENRYFLLGGRWNQTPHLPLKDDLKIKIRELTKDNSIIYNNWKVLMILNS